MNKTFSWEAFNRIPVIGIMRNIAPEKMEILASRYIEAGFNTLEITMNSLDAAKTITHLTNEFGERLNIGAGTVLTLEDLDTALSSGAMFVVTPILNEDVIKACVARKIPVFPGAYTPTEIYKAWSMGASMVKVFPATQSGAQYIKEVLAPLNHIKLIPTGGISVHNFADFLRAGAKGLGMGSQLFSPELIKNDRWDELDKVFTEFVKRYDDFLGSREVPNIPSWER